MDLQNAGKFSHFGMAVLRRGGRVKKKRRPLAVLRDRVGNGHCPLEKLPYFDEPRLAHLVDLTSHIKNRISSYSRLPAILDIYSIYTKVFTHYMK